MRLDELNIRKAYLDEDRDIRWEVNVIPPDSNNFIFGAFSEIYGKEVGIGHAEMAGKPITKALSSKTAELVQSKYSLCVNFRRQITYSEYLDVGDQGWRHWRTTMKPRFDDQGRIYRLLGTAVEIVGVESDLRNAINDQGLAVHYQPIFDVSGAQPALEGYEALIRWPGSGYGPGDFLPVAKASGLMPNITKIVLEDVAHHLQQTQGQPWIAINISDCLTAHDLGNAIKKFGLGSDWLRLEITEDTELTKKLIAEYQKIISLGAIFELDDYGTERSNPVWLRHIPIQTLKLEAQFVTNAYQYPNKAAICRSAVTLAQAYAPPLNIIAEGVETDEDLEFVKCVLGIRTVQGYLLGAPSPWEKKSYATISETAGC